MKQGLLIFDDTPGRSLERKIELATKRHRRKFWSMPDTCYVHPSALDDVEELQIGSVIVRPLATVLKDHLWIGRNDGTTDSA